MVQQLNMACLVIDITFEVVGSIFCLGRLVSRLLSAKGSWRGLMMWSDICMFIAWTSSVGETVTMVYTTILGHFGYHFRDMINMKTNPVELAKWELASGMCYNPILGLVKASMILLYLRLGGTKRGVKIACYGLLFLTLSLTVSLELADLLQCMPISYAWDNLALDRAAQEAQNATEVVILPGYGPVSGFKNGKYVYGGRCYDRVKFVMVAAALAIGTDLLILCIPVYMVYGLKMKLRRKIVVLLVLCMGISITAVSITRLVFLYRLYYTPADLDKNYSVSSSINQIESGLALVAGNIPDLFPMIRRWFPNFLRSDSPDALAPNPYPYVRSHTGGSTYSNRLQKGYRPVMVRSTRGSRIPEAAQETGAFGMETHGWRGDMVAGREVEVKGGTRSLSGSEEAIIEKGLGQAGGIVKTMHFVVQENNTGPPRLSLEQRRWSNI